MIEEGLLFTDTRPRAKATGHAFGFEGNLGMVVIASGMVSVLIVTLLLNASNQMPMPVSFAIASVPLLLTTGYIAFFRNKRPPRFDLDLLITRVNGRTLRPARSQPLHPFLPTR